MENQELNEKLAIWRGFTKGENYYKDEGLCIDWWAEPNSTNFSALPDFTTDLNACFKWLPALVDDFGIYYDGSTKEYKAWARKDHITSEVISDKNVALALCKAIENLIDASK